MSVARDELRHGGNVAARDRGIAERRSGDGRGGDDPPGQQRVGAAVRLHAQRTPRAARRPADAGGAATGRGRFAGRAARMRRAGSRRWAPVASWSAAARTAPRIAVEIGWRPIQTRRAVSSSPPSWTSASADMSRTRNARPSSGNSSSSGSSPSSPFSSSTFRAMRSSTRSGRACGESAKSSISTDARSSGSTRMASCSMPSIGPRPGLPRSRRPSRPGHDARGRSSGCSPASWSLFSTPSEIPSEVDRHVVRHDRHQVGGLHPPVG